MKKVVLSRFVVDYYTVSLQRVIQLLINIVFFLIFSFERECGLRERRRERNVGASEKGKGGEGERMTRIDEAETVLARQTRRANDSHASPVAATIGGKKAET